MNKLIDSIQKTFLILILSLALFTNAFSQSNYQYECISIKDDGYITFKIWNPQKGKNYKFNQARKDAIYAILVSGVPSNENCASQKPLLQNQEGIEKFRDVEKEFFDNKGVWETFTRSSEIETTMPVSLGKKEWKVYQVSVSKNLLRKYLEEKNIVKPLKTGF